MAPELGGLAVDQLDVATVRGSNRLITRAVAAWAYAASDDDDLPRHSGIRYMSRLGEYECWAVFDGNRINEISRSTIEANNPDLKAAADHFGLRVF